MGRATGEGGGGQQATSISKGDRDHGKLEHFVWEPKPHLAVAVKAGGGSSQVAGGHRGQRSYPQTQLQALGKPLGKPRGRFRDWSADPSPSTED